MKTVAANRATRIFVNVDVYVSDITDFASQTCVYTKGNDHNGMYVLNR